MFITIERQVKKLKKSMLFLIALLLLSGCVEEGNALDNGSVEKKPRNPSYLQVYQAYQRTALYDQCNAYGEEIMDTDHERYGVEPYTFDDDMDIVRSYQTDTAYVYEVKCEITAQYQLNAFAYIQEDFEKPLGEVTINK